MKPTHASRQSIIYAGAARSRCNRGTGEVRSDVARRIAMCAQPRGDLARPMRVHTWWPALAFLRPIAERRDQMRLANALCRYIEIASRLPWAAPG
jgi:hypothetical protein